jgi:hypothetical protein
MRINVNYIDTSQDRLDTFVDAFEMGREAAKKVWGDE